MNESIDIKLTSSSVRNKCVLLLNLSVQSQISQDREVLLYSRTYILYTQELDAIGWSLCDVRGMGREACFFVNEFITANNLSITNLISKSIQSYTSIIIL